ncbi:hypothetical protein [Streptomyces albidoflavus]|uniref:helix-turn-helix transcriptional regulator n=1 Tax=Streptomyces albidoflavus TaxID=1886 RepID=UPI0033A31F81
MLLALPETVRPLDEQVDVAAAATAGEVSGASVHVYLPPSEPGGGDRPHPCLAALAKDGIEFHPSPGPLPRMAIIDRNLVVMARNQADYGDGALIGRDLPFTSLLVSSLTAPEPNGEAAPPDAGELTPLSREVLRQLSRGVKDEVAARELGMALRTYRRTVASLMETLQAGSRFQAGYLAAQRNWI